MSYPHLRDIWSVPSFSVHLWVLVRTFYKDKVVDALCIYTMIIANKIYKNNGNGNGALELSPGQGKFCVPECLGLGDEPGSV